MRVVALKLIKPTEVVPEPWYRRQWVWTTGQVAWWLLLFTVELALTCLWALLILAGALLMALGTMAHFMGENR